MLSTAATTKPLDQEAQHPVALQLARYLAAQREHRLGIGPFQRVSHGIFTERPDAFRQHTAPLTGRLDAMESGILASRAEHQNAQKAFTFARTTSHN
jgi:hypothetical protein